MAKTNHYETDLKKERWQRNLAIYEEFQRLTADPLASKVVVTRHLMKKYNLHSESTVWAIRKKVERALATKE